MFGGGGGDGAAIVSWRWRRHAWLRRRHGGAGADRDLGATGLYKVDAAMRAVVTRFGQYVATTEPACAGT